MTIRDYWIYQERESTTPFALYVVKEYDRRHPEATVIDYTLYSETIENSDNAISRIDLHFDDARGYAETIAMTMDAFGVEVTGADLIQLENEIEKILND